MSAPVPDTAAVTALWRLVWDSAKSNPATLLALISALTALATTIVTPLLSFYTMRRQIRATLVSANRQAWINALRDDLSEIFELLTRHFALRSKAQAGEQTEKRARVVFLGYRIQLRLNPLEENSKKLGALIFRLQALDDGGERSVEKDDQFRVAMAAAVSTSQEILKTEWKRVKKGR